MLRVGNLERVLGVLRRASDPVSGTRLSERLGVSRTAVWKYIGTLRRAGYKIEALPARGYRLLAVPDRVLPGQIIPLLKTSRIGRRMEYFERVGSTNTEAAALARQGEPEGTAVIAEKQSRGRGRMGRSWFSPARANLYASIILRPPVPPAVAPQLSLVAGLAAARAVESEGAAAVSIKWPNDVLIAGEKVAGILTEAEAEADQVRWVVVGIGVNLNSSRSQFPSYLRGRASSVRVGTGRRVDRCRFAARLFGEVEMLYDRFLGGGFASLKPDWEKRAYLTGRSVIAESPSGRVAGRVLGIDGGGALLVESARGTERVLAGDVALRGAYRRA